MFDSVDALSPLFEGARTVVFNGDTREIGHEPWRDRSEMLLGELRALCAGLGAEAVFLTGNHDHRISELGWLELRRGAVLVTHGDMLLPEVVPWSLQYLRKSKSLAELAIEHLFEDGVDFPYATQWRQRYPYYASISYGDSLMLMFLELALLRNGCEADVERLGLECSIR